MKKRLLTLIIVGCFAASISPVAASSKFQQRLSCKVAEQSVRVYLIPEEGTLPCQQYISVVNSYLKIEYDIMLQILTNLQRGDDVDYRKALYLKKKDQFLKLFSQRTMIQTAMQQFEDDLFIKSKAYLGEILEPRIGELEAQIVLQEIEMGNQPYHNVLQVTLRDTKKKLEIIRSLMGAQNMDAFIEDLQRYVSLLSFS